jgi:DNA-binding NarL/FixJ family response regulator
VIADARRVLGGAEFQKSWSKGANLPLEDVMREVIAWASESFDSTAARNRERRLQIGEGLTRRQQEVLRLVASGLSDQQIAEALFISYPAVTSHLTTILTTLGVDNRAAAAAYAVGHGLA